MGRYRSATLAMMALIRGFCSSTLDAFSTSIARFSPATWWRLGILLAVLVILTGMRKTVLDFYCVKGPSMEPTLFEGDCFLADKMAFRNKTPRHGDLVILARASDKEEHLIKRIIALPGDTLVMQAGGLYLNNKRLEESYADLFQGDSRNLTKPGIWHYSFLLSSVNRYRYEPTGRDWGPIGVPDSAYFVLGDNRSKSMDSRSFGFIQHHELLARPINHTGRRLRKLAPLRRDSTPGQMS